MIRHNQSTSQNKAVAHWLQTLYPNTGHAQQITKAGFCQLATDDDRWLIITLMNEGQEFALISYLQPSCKKLNKTALLKLLGYNYSEDQMNGCVIGYCLQTDTLILKATLHSTTLDAIAFENALSNFILTRDTVEEKIALELMTEDAKLLTSHDHQPNQQSWITV